jgi:hypothetical protein
MFVTIVLEEYELLENKPPKYVGAFLAQQRKMEMSLFVSDEG